MQRSFPEDNSYQIYQYRCQSEWNRQVHPSLLTPQCDVENNPFSFFNDTSLYSTGQQENRAGTQIMQEIQYKNERTSNTGPLRTRKSNFTKAKPYAIGLASRNGRSERRKTASDREKLRMQGVTRQLNVLKDHLPSSWLPDKAKTSKINILRIAISYINYLSEQLSADSVDNVDHDAHENTCKIDFEFQDIIDYIDDSYCGNLEQGEQRTKLSLFR